MAEPGSMPMAAPEGPLVDSLIICQMKRERDIRSRPASQRWLLSAGERERKVGSPNSAYNGEISQSYYLPRKERTGETRLLRGCGGKIGITMRSITKAEAIKETKASTRAGMRGIIFSVNR